MPTALVQGRIAVQHAHLLREYLSDAWDILVWDPAKNDPDEFAPMALKADAVIGGTIPLEHWPPTPNMKLFQIPWTGYDFCSPATMPAGIPVCNCFEHESSISEYVLATMLESRIGLRSMDANFRKEGWGGRPPGENVLHREVRDCTVGIVGYGHIGEEVAKRAKAFGMRVIGVRRSEQPTPELLDWLGTTDRLHELLRESDFVVIACPLTDETRGLIDAEAFAAMKPDAFLINVARGKVVDEQALFDALKSNKIGGAAIDVWYNYIGPDKKDVWPSNLPFQELDNIILSAHESGTTDKLFPRRWKFVAANLERAIDGEALKNFVFEGIQKNS